MAALSVTPQRFWTSTAVAIVVLAGGVNFITAQQPIPFPQVEKEAPKPVDIPPPQMQPVAIPVSRFNFVIDPKTPVKELLPMPPKAKTSKPSAFVDNLSDAPELMLAEPLPKTPPQVGVESLAHEDIKAIAHQIAKINHLNKEKSDRFMEVLLAERSDLAGLPFQMGNQCRLPTVRSKHFSQAVAIVHSSRGIQRTSVTSVNVTMIPVAPTAFDTSGSKLADENGSAFLIRFLQMCTNNDDAIAPSRLQEHRDHAIPARLAAMTQICGPTSDSMKLALAKYLSSVSSVDSTKALVKTILFSAEPDVRDEAIAALKARREADYIDLLLQGFRYPWPEVAKRSAEALVKLERKDLIPKIIEVLDDADPRAPIVENKDGKTLTKVNELVRINHHRNCLMCHAPGQDVSNTADVLTAEVPIPSRPLQSSNNGGYGSQNIPELLVRIDVTYLRQDFSMMLPVADAAPWPEMQRFDFVVRTRVLKDDEVKAYREKFDNLEPGVLPPNHKAALIALRELTGKDTAPTAEAWRTLLKVTK